MKYIGKSETGGSVFAVGKVNKAGKFKPGDRVEVDADELDEHGYIGTIIQENPPGHYNVKLEHVGNMDFQEGELRKA